MVTGHHEFDRSRRSRSRRRRSSQVGGGFMAPGVDCAAVHVLGVAGPSGSGKTSMIERLVPRLGEGRGRDRRNGGTGRPRVATVKSIHHDVEVDEPGKDTHRHREAGAEATVGITPSRTFGFTERGKSSGVHGAVGREEATVLEPLLSGFADRGIDHVLVEGFASATIPKVVVGSSEEDGDGRGDVAEPVVASVDDGETAALGTVLDAIAGVRSFETATSALERERGVDPPGAIAVVSADSSRLDDPTDWTHDRIPEPLTSIREALVDRSAVQRVAVHLRPPVSSDGTAAVHVVVRAVNAERAFAAASDAGDRLGDSSIVDGPVGFLLREG